MPYRRDPRSRISLFIANISLVIGLLLSTFVHPANQIEKNWVHFFTGFLVALSVTVNLRALILARRRGDQA
jgi:hypothetical protein